MILQFFQSLHPRENCPKETLQSTQSEKDVVVDQYHDFVKFVCYNFFEYLLSFCILQFLEVYKIFVTHEFVNFFKRGYNVF